MHLEIRGKRDFVTIYRVPQIQEHGAFENLERFAYFPGFVVTISEAFKLDSLAGFVRRAFYDMADDVCFGELSILRVMDRKKAIKPPFYAKISIFA